MHSEPMCNMLQHNFEGMFSAQLHRLIPKPALQLAQGLRVRTYPYVGLLAFSGSRTRLIAAAEGCFMAEALLPILQEAQEQQAVHLVAEQAEQNERVSIYSSSSS